MHHTLVYLMLLPKVTRKRFQLIFCDNYMRVYGYKINKVLFISNSFQKPVNLVFTILSRENRP